MHVIKALISITKKYLKIRHGIDWKKTLRKFESIDLKKKNEGKKWYSPKYNKFTKYSNYMFFFFELRIKLKKCDSRHYLKLPIS